MRDTKPIPALQAAVVVAIRNQGSFLVGQRTNIKNRIKKPYNPSHHLCEPGSLGSITVGRICWRNIAKEANKKPLCKIDKITFFRSHPFAMRRDKASGMAAPIANRKKGKTKSTQVSPASLGLKA